MQLIQELLYFTKRIYLRYIQIKLHNTSFDKQLERSILNYTACPHSVSYSQWKYPIAVYNYKALIALLLRVNDIV